MITIMPRKGPLTNKVSPMEWGERNRSSKNQIVPMQCAERAKDSGINIVPVLVNEWNSSAKTIASVHKDYGERPKSAKSNRILPEELTQSRDYFSPRTRNNQVSPVLDSDDDDIAIIHLPPNFGEDSSNNYEHTCLPS